MLKYLHTNLTVSDLDGISDFYQKVFNCVPVREVQTLSGEWLEEITGVKGATMRYVHLKFPGYKEDGPELELIEYKSELKIPEKYSNASGFTHISFGVENVRDTLDAILEAGGDQLGDIVTVDIPNRGTLTEVYATDPEGNIIELQHYDE